MKKRHEEAGNVGSGSRPGSPLSPEGGGGLKLFAALADNHIEMNSTDHDRQLAPLRRIPPDRAGLAFAAFALEHSGCEEASSELRLDERTLIGWCWRCNELRIFATDEGK